MALTEPGAGSDASSITTRRSLIDKYISNGTKCLLPMAPSVMVVVVPELAEQKGSSGCTAFIVDRSMPGWYAGQNLTKWVCGLPYFRISL